MKIEDHIAQDMILFGKSFDKVHEELDATDTLMGHPHRKDTHYLEFVLKKFKNGEWDAEECRSAIQHIIDDCGFIMIWGDWENSEDIQDNGGKKMTNKGLKCPECDRIDDIEETEPDQFKCSCGHEGDIKEFMQSHFDDIQYPECYTETGMCKEQELNHCRCNIDHGACPKSKNCEECGSTLLTSENGLYCTCCGLPREGTPKE